MSPKQPTATTTTTIALDLEHLPAFLNVDEAAALLRVNRKSLYDALKRGEIAGAHRVGRSYRIARDVLLASFGQPGVTGKGKHR